MMISLTDSIAKHAMKIKGIIHVGGHYGQEIEEYLRLGIKNVLFIEPANKPFEQLSKNLAEKVPAELKATYNGINVAAGAYNGKSMMNTETANEGQSSSLLSPAKHLQHYPSIVFDKKEIVNVVRLCDMDIDWSLFNMLNMDVQGYELEVLKGTISRFDGKILKDVLSNIDYVYSEVNTDELYEGCAKIGDIDIFLSEFERVDTKMTDVGWGDALYLRTKREVQKHVDKNFGVVDASSTTEESLQVKGLDFDPFELYDENIVILAPGVSLKFEKNSYVQLVTAINSRLGESLNKHIKNVERLSAEYSDVHRVMKDIRSLFYDQFGAGMTRKTPQEIDVDKLDEIVNKLDKFLGIQTEEDGE
jgi:FkbM family methyltransferase